MHMVEMVIKDGIVDCKCNNAPYPHTPPGSELQCAVVDQAPELLAEPGGDEGVGGTLLPARPDGPGSLPVVRAPAAHLCDGKPTALK